MSDPIPVTCPTIGLHDAFIATIEAYPLNRAELAEKAGVSDSLLSRFLRRQTDISLAKLQRLLEHLPDEAQQHFWQLVSPASQTEQLSLQKTTLMHSLRQYLQQCSLQDFQEFLGVIVKARETVLKN